MSMFTVVSAINARLDIPAVIIFFGAALLLTVKTGFLQFRGFGTFIKILTKKADPHQKTKSKAGSIDSLHALFTAMATTIGMGNLVGPTVAVFAGGPGALFWLVAYMFFASVTKYVEVCFAIDTRIKTPNGHIIGGPMEYLKLLHPLLAQWYVGVMIFLFAGWSALQSNTLAAIYALEGIPEWFVGGALAAIVLLVLQGGAQRVGNVASKIVPFMFFLYMTFGFLILFRDITVLYQAFALIFSNIFAIKSVSGGFVGMSILMAMRSGIYKGIYISEAGIGTSSIPHAMTDAQKGTDQGLLALYSMAADALISTMSGLLVLVTGVWMFGDFRSTLIYEVFKMHAPGIGQAVLLLTVSLFVLTTVIGNSFNGVQTYASITSYRYMWLYTTFTIICIFFGSMLNVRLAWEIMELLLTMVAIPNVLGIVYLAFKKPKVIQV